MGEHPERVLATGCPSVDLAKEVIENPAFNFDPFEKYHGVGHQINLNDGYIVVMQHPVTTEYRQSRHDVEETLYAVNELGLHVLWFWPNVDAGSDGTSKGIRAFRELEKPKDFYFFKNMEGRDFLRLLYNSTCLIGNSSVGVRECSYLGVPVVNIGTRQQNRERGKNVIDVSYDRVEIKKAIQTQINAGRYEPDLIYGDGGAGEKIAEALGTVPLIFQKSLAY